MGSAFQTLGWNYLTETFDDGYQDTLMAGPSVVSPIAGEIVSVTVFVNTAAGNLRVGIYDATGSLTYPGALLGESASTPAVAGWQEIPLATPAAIAAGQPFWVAICADDNTYGGRCAGPDTGTSIFVPHTFGPLPDPFPGGSTAFPRVRSIFCRVNPT